MRCSQLSCIVVAALCWTCLSDNASAQLISRIKDRKSTAKDKEQDTPQRLVPQPSIAGPTQASAELDSSDQPATSDRARIKPVPLTITPPPAAKPAVKAATALPANEPTNTSVALPHLSVETTAPAQVNLGRRAKYTILVRNNGESRIDGVALRVAIPDGAEFAEADPVPAISDDRLTFDLRNLEPGITRTLQLAIIPKKRGPMDLATHVVVTATTHTSTDVRSPELAVVLHGPSEAIVGDTVTFKATVKNVGDGIAQDVAIVQLLPSPASEGEIAQTDAVLEQLQSRIAQIPPGESEEVELPALATATGTLRANIVVRAADGLETAASTEVRIRQPVIEIRTIGPESRPVQRAGGYVILVSNSGDVAAEGVVVSAIVPKGLEVVGVEKRTTFDKRTGTLRWNLAKLDAGATESLKFQIRATEEGDREIRVTAAGSRKLSAETTQHVRISGKADLALNIDDTPGPIEVGGQVGYEIHVKNCGTKAVHNVVVRCTVPHGLEVADARQFSRDGGDLEFEAIGTLAVGEEKVLQLTAVGREPGDQLIHFSVRCDSLPNEISNETSTFFFKSNK